MCHKINALCNGNISYQAGCIITVCSGNMTSEVQGAQTQQELSYKIR